LVAAAPARSLPTNVRVVVYTTSWCPVCKRAKRWMAEHGVAFEERDVEASADVARQMRAINPRGSVPTFDVDGQVMVGFSESGLAAAMERAAAQQRL
jgi:glutaredoxin